MSIYSIIGVILGGLYLISYVVYACVSLIKAHKKLPDPFEYAKGCIEITTQQKTLAKMLENGVEVNLDTIIKSLKGESITEIKEINCPVRKKLDKLG